ncbi:hypothetical protein AB0J14_22270 [Micromonospora arborensis]|uniref:hypothetical protein n=1 Tax=Micromonospora arborensis TaxID=2116518 RepID=UPI0033EAEE4D
MVEDLAVLNETVRLLSQENDRIERALRDWHTIHLPSHRSSKPSSSRSNLV